VTDDPSLAQVLADLREVLDRLRVLDEPDGTVLEVGDEATGGDAWTYRVERVW
jgi:hypothetical protein